MTSPRGTTSPGGMSGLAFSMQMRDTIERMVKERIDAERPRYRYATVESINRTDRKCSVIFNGDTASVQVNMGSVQPNSVGQVVRVEGISTDKFITDVIGEPWNGSRWGVVEPLYTAGPVRVKWNGDAQFSGPYAIAAGYRPESGDTVLGTYVPGEGFVVSRAMSATIDQPLRWYDVKTHAVNGFENGWTDYQARLASGAQQGWPPVTFSRSRTGIVHLRSLIMKPTAGVANETMFTLPVGFRPAATMLVQGQSNASTAAHLNIFPDGRVVFRGGSNAWLSLSDIMFPSAEIAPNEAWTVPTLLNGMTQYTLINPIYPNVGWWIDADGIVWRRGIANRTAVTTGRVDIFTDPSHAQSAGATIHRNVSNNAWVRTELHPTGVTAFTQMGAAAWVSLDCMWTVPNNSPLNATAQQPSMSAGWAAYAGGWAQQVYFKTADHLIYSRGLIASATAAGAGVVVGKVLRDAVPYRNDMFGVVAGQTSGHTYARMDILSHPQLSSDAGEYITREGASNIWISLVGRWQAESVWARP